MGQMNAVDAQRREEFRTWWENWGGVVEVLTPVGVLQFDSSDIVEKLDAVAWEESFKLFRDKKVKDGVWEDLG